MLISLIQMPGGHQGGHPDVYFTSKYNLEFFPMVFTEFETLLQNEIYDLSYSSERPPMCPPPSI